MQQNPQYRDFMSDYMSTDLDFTNPIHAVQKRPYLITSVSFL